MSDKFDVEDEGNLASLLVVTAATIGGIAIGWVARQLLGDRKLRSEFEELKQTLGLTKKIENIQKGKPQVAQN